MGIIKTGCCGFSVSRKKYFENLDTVEIQETFYQLPEEKTVKRWRDEAPPHFRYTMKVWQLITHEPSSPTYRRLKIKIPDKKKKNFGFFKNTDEVMEAWLLTEKIAQILNAEILIFQCPPSFTPSEENIKNMKRFFTMIRRNNFLFAWEPRGDWDESIIKSLCEELELIHTVDPFMRKPLYGNKRYFRLHGIGGYRYRYTCEDLRKLLQIITEDREYYIMFNNIFMFENAVEFKNMLLQPNIKDHHKGKPCDQTRGSDV